LCLLLGGLHEREKLLGWQFWGVLLLLIVWAALRQGLRGGTLVAAASAIPVLTLRQLLPADRLEDPQFAPLLQAHLFAQCGAAVLIASAAAWIRLNETGYRQVVSHIPVVIYSARLTQPRPLESPPPRAPGDDETHTNNKGLTDTHRGDNGGAPAP